MSAWKVILSTLVIFIAGAVTGGLLVTNAVRVVNAVNFKHPKTPPAQANAANANPWQVRNKELLRRMDKELELTPGQHEHIEAIIANSQDRTKALWKPIAPQMNKEILVVRSEIRDQLTADQKTKFDALLKSRPGQEKHRLNPNTNFNNASNSLTLTNPSADPQVSKP